MPGRGTSTSFFAVNSLAAFSGSGATMAACILCA